MCDTNPRHRKSWSFLARFGPAAGVPLDIAAVGEKRRCRPGKKRPAPSEADFYDSINSCFTLPNEVSNKKESVMAEVLVVVVLVLLIVFLAKRI